MTWETQSLCYTKRGGSYMLSPRPYCLDVIEVKDLVIYLLFRCDF